MLIAASASAQSASTRPGVRSEATIQIRVSVAPRFMTSNRTTTESGGVSTNIASNAPGLRYKVIAQQDMAGGGGPTGRAQSAPSSTLLLIVPD